MAAAFRFGLGEEEEGEWGCECHCREGPRRTRADAYVVPSTPKPRVGSVQIGGKRKHLQFRQAFRMPDLIKYLILRKTLKHVRIKL